MPSPVPSALFSTMSLIGYTRIRSRVGLRRCEGTAELLLTDMASHYKRHGQRNPIGARSCPGPTAVLLGASLKPLGRHIERAVVNEIRVT